MQWILSLRSLAFGLVAVSAISLTGCKDSQVTQESPAGATEVAHGEDGHEEHGHGAHDGWWCGEHGVPEEVCAQCDSSLIAEFKEDGDWCEKHHRPESQCFICGPERFDKFAARYKAKTGEDPAKPEALTEASGS